MISFQPDNFVEYEDLVKNGLERLADAQRAVDGADVAIAQWTQKSIYLKVIEADIVTGISKVTPTDTYVLRPAEAAQIAANVA